jgi:hypothetical protein
LVLQSQCTDLCRSVVKLAVTKIMPRTATVSTKDIAQHSRCHHCSVGRCLPALRPEHPAGSCHSRNQRRTALTAHKRLT